MNRAAGARERIIKASQYNPSSISETQRAIRVVGFNGKTQTFKKKGDIVIDERGRKWEVSQDGWY